MEHVNSKVITPSSGFVVKGFTENGLKCFVNVCFSFEIGPAQKSDDGRVRVPMSIGDMADDLDKKLQPCKCVDVIVNEGCIVRAGEDAEFKKSFVEFILSGVESKHKIKLGNMRALKLGYKGVAVKQQRVRVDRASFITEIESACDMPVDPPEFSFEMVNEITGDRVNVLQLPQYMSPKTVLRENLQEFLLGDTIRSVLSLEKKAEAKHRVKTIDFKVFRKAEIMISEAEGMKLKVSSRRLLVLSNRLSLSPSFSIWFPVRMDADSAKAELCCIISENAPSLKVSIFVQ